MPVPACRSRRTVLVLYYSCSAVCGVGTWVECLSNELERRDWRVVVGLAWGRRFHDPRRVERQRPSLKTVWMDGRTGTEEGRVQAVERTIRSVRPDVVVLACLDSTFEAVRRLRREGMRFRFVATNHGNCPEQAASLMGQRDVVDMTVCVGKLSAEVMSIGGAGYALDRIRHISNPVPLPTAVPEAHRSPFRVGYAGRLDGEERKRVSDIGPFFEELSNRCPSAELWIAGNGPQEMEVRSMAGRFPGRVSCLGGLTRAELYERFYPLLDAYVNFSSNEGWGLSIAEAMAHGVVPVSSAFMGIRTEGLVHDGGNGLVFPVGDTNRAAVLVSDIFADPSRRSALSRRAAQDIREKYSPARFGDEWSRALAHCIDLPDLPPSSEPGSLMCRSRWGGREASLERIRRFLRRRVPHASAGEEWPHYRCKDRSLAERLAFEMKAIETA
jgi:glycosyltransferase involved in cell wall biosynthesis